MKSLFYLPYKLLPKNLPLLIFTWLLWFGVLWYSSSRSSSDETPQLFPHVDKVLHFGYFFGGAILLAQLLSTARIKRLSSIHIVIYCIIAGATIGAIDEYHQSFTPGRYGNDVFDWLADCLGTTAGVIYLLWAKSQTTQAKG